MEIAPELDPIALRCENDGKRVAQSKPLVRGKAKNAQIDTELNNKNG